MEHRLHTFCNAQDDKLKHHNPKKFYFMNSPCRFCLGFKLKGGRGSDEAPLRFADGCLAIASSDGSPEWWKKERLSLSLSPIPHLDSIHPAPLATRPFFHVVQWPHKKTIRRQTIVPCRIGMSAVSGTVFFCSVSIAMFLTILTNRSHGAILIK